MDKDKVLIAYYKKVDAKGEPTHTEEVEVGNVRTYTHIRELAEQNSKDGDVFFRFKTDNMENFSGFAYL